MPPVVYVPEEYHTGGAYAAIQASASWWVYIGTTVYAGTGERTPGPASQTKVHTKPVIARDR